MASPLLATASAHLKSKGIAVNAMYDGTGQKTNFDGEERYPARLLFPDGTRKVYEGFTMDSVSSDELLRDLEHKPRGLTAVDGAKEIIVCTHGSRDCRYAANALLLPTLDMMSNLTAEHAPALISHLQTPGSMWSHWRGRIGLTEGQQEDLWAKVGKEPPAHEAPPAETVTLRFKTYEGEERVVQGAIGESLLSVGKRHDLPSLEGVCGGNLECATCHLYMSTSPDPPVEEASDEEYDMLGYALGYKDGESRLGCQVKVTQALGEWCAQGGVITLPRF
ncbi:hypothetical protein IAU60_005872 [Kwoniella sp. DSM 27419]